MTRMLWVTEEVPDADLGGGSIREYHVLRRVAKAIDTDLLLVGHLGDDGLRNSLSQVIELPRPPARPVDGYVRGRVRSVRRTVSGRYPLEIRDAVAVHQLLARHLKDTSKYDVVDIEHEVLAPLLPADRDNRWVITLHNLISQRARQRSALSRTSRSRWLYEADAQRAERFEKWITAKYDVTMVMSDNDQAALDGPATVVPNGVDTDRFRFTPLPSEPRLVFSASFNYEPNIDAAHWFCSNVFPLVRERVPDATLSLVGREPPQAVRALARLSGVEGRFDVPSVVPYLAAARVAVVPIRIGTGTRLKALEAMSAGRPLAGTSLGLAGLGLNSGVSALIADEPFDLALAIERLCRDDGYASTLTRNARQLVDARFSWDFIGRRYLEVVLEAHARRTDQEAV